MAHFVMLGYSSPADDEHDEQFSEWYEGSHVPKKRGVAPAITRVRRFRVVSEPTSSAPVPDDAPEPHRYLTIYEFEAPNAYEVVEPMWTLAQEDEDFRFTEHQDRSENPPRVEIYEQISEL